MYAPEIKDDQKFEFDWPSEAIKKACEEMFPTGKEWIFPALNWIPAENGEGRPDSMQDVQQQH